VFDPAFQFHYLRARWYNPKSGRFLERDSVRGAPTALHRYASAQHNPLAYHDPTGHWAWPVSLLPNDLTPLAWLNAPLAQDEGSWLLAWFAAANVMSRIPPGSITIPFGDRSAGLVHVFGRHLFNVPGSSASAWTVSELQVATLIRNAEYATRSWLPTRMGGYARLIQVETDIGMSRGRPVDFYTVIVDRSQSPYRLITAFPGTIQEFVDLGLVPEFVPVINRFASWLP
jgi:RHS repeat-associated protein